MFIQERCQEPNLDSKTTVPDTFSIRLLSDEVVAGGDIDDLTVEAARFAVEFAKVFRVQEQIGNVAEACWSFKLAIEFFHQM